MNIPIQKLTIEVKSCRYNKWLSCFKVTIFKYFRFQEDSAEILKLREKEKGDWKKLTLAEKKVLYRASFCQTIAEVK